MRTLTAALLSLALVSVGAHAQELSSDAEAEAARTAQRVTYFGSDFMSVVQQATAYPHAGLTHVKLDVYFFDPSSLYTPGTRVDYIRYNAVIDCSNEGGWVAKSWAAYREGQSKPVLTGKDKEGQWRGDAEGSPGYANWRGICRDVYDEYDVSFPRTMPATEVLKNYRQNIRSGS